MDILTGNELMMNVMSVLQEFIMAGMVKTTPEPRDREYSRKIHHELLDAIRSRDPKVAGEAMDHHMKLSETSLRQTDEKQESSAPAPRSGKKRAQ